MNTSSHDFVTVDMRGLKAALVACATAERVSVSVLVRAAVSRDLGLAEGHGGRADAFAEGALRSNKVKLSIRMTTQEAEQLANGARAAGMSRGAYLAGLVANVPLLQAGASRGEHIAGLVTSTSELSTLSRSIHRLAALLRQANVEAARPYLDMLKALDGDVRCHLEVAARVLADLQPHRRGAPPTCTPTA